jgi:hypothetical protein
MFELIGLIFGGVSRLGQHWMEMKDKQAERDHEARMFEAQVKLQEMQASERKELKQMDLQITQDTNDTNALIAAIQSQTAEAQHVGGWVEKFNAMMRPLLTFYHCIVVYTAAKIAQFYIASIGGVVWSAAFLQVYTEADRAIAMSILSYVFVDRSLKKWAGK